MIKRALKQREIACNINKENLRAIQINLTASKFSKLEKKYLFLKNEYEQDQKRQLMNN